MRDRKSKVFKKGLDHAYKWLKDDLLVILNTFYTTWPYFLISIFDKKLDLCYIRGRFSIQGLQKTNPCKNIFNSWGI